MPDRSNTPQSDKQKEHQQEFQQAIVYAKNALADPIQKAAYEAKTDGNQTAFNIAVADFFHAPNIEAIDLSAYTGKLGDKIRVEVTDDFMVTSVTIHIYNPDGSLVEEGPAVPDAGNPLWWVYTAKAVNTTIAGDKIIVKATDRPGHQTEQTKVI